MTIDELIGQGWNDHADKTAEVADRLEANLELVTDDTSAAGFMNLVNHAIGDHLGQRERAERLCEAALARLEAEPGTAPLLFLAVARRLAGNEQGALEAEGRLGDDPAIPLRVGMLVAQGHMHAAAWDTAASLYGEMLGRAEALEAGHSGERATAVVSNNIASELLQLETRSAAQDALMEQAAEAAHTFWNRVGNWVNDERGDYLKALVYTALQRPAEGRVCAERGLKTIADNRETADQEKVDHAFLLLARAGACREVGDAETRASSLAEADQIAATFNDEGLTSWFGEERAKVK